MILFIFKEECPMRTRSRQLLCGLLLLSLLLVPFTPVLHINAAGENDTVREIVTTLYDNDYDDATASDFLSGTAHKGSADSVHKLSLESNGGNQYIAYRLHESDTSLDYYLDVTFAAGRAGKYVVEVDLSTDTTAPANGNIQLRSDTTKNTFTFIQFKPSGAYATGQLQDGEVIPGTTPLFTLSRGGWVSLRVEIDLAVGVADYYVDGEHRYTASASFTADDNTIDRVRISTAKGNCGASVLVDNYTVTSVTTIQKPDPIYDKNGVYISADAVSTASLSCSSQYSQMPASYAADLNDSTSWRTLAADRTPSLTAALTFPADLNMVRLLLLNPQNYTTFTLQYTAGTSAEWHDITTVTVAGIDEHYISFSDIVDVTALRVVIGASSTPLGIYSFSAVQTNDTGAVKEYYNGMLADQLLPSNQYKTFEQSEAVSSQLVTVNPDGSLTYTAYDGQGSQLMDYSTVGYREGAPLPDVPVVRTVDAAEWPDMTDHTDLIQNAINEVSALPEDQRGAVLLKAGVYILSDTLTIKASGVVLTGEGQGPDGTVLYDGRDTQCDSLVIGAGSSYSTDANTLCYITDTLVPVGTHTYTLAPEDLAAFEVGDRVILTFLPNEHWLETLGMDQMEAYADATGGNASAVNWNNNSMKIAFERLITAIDRENGTFTTDVSASLTFDQQYCQVSVARLTDDQRIYESGVRNLRFESYYDETVSNDENHGWAAVKVKNCYNCFVENVTSKYYGYATVQVQKGARNVTVLSCSSLSPVSQITGGRRYSFCIDGGQLTLIENCYSQGGRHDFVVQSQVAGPNVFLDCIADNSNSVSEPHHRWSSGTLYDNCKQVGNGSKINGHFETVNRGDSGTGHGWAGANTVFWNCLSPAIIVAAPQTEQNFAIGVMGIYTGVSATSYLGMYRNYSPALVDGKYDTAYFDPQSYSGSPLYGNEAAYIESPYNPVNPTSLYRAQLAWRTAGNAVLVQPNAPILLSPAPDQTIVSDTRIKVEGMYTRGASEIRIYIDGVLQTVSVTMIEDTCSFVAALTVSGGYHTITVEQVIDGTVSRRTAERIFYVSNGDESDTGIIDPRAVFEELKAEQEYEELIGELQSTADRLNSQDASLQQLLDTVLNEKNGMHTAIAARDEEAYRTASTAYRGFLYTLSGKISQYEQDLSLADTYKDSEDPVLASLAAAIREKADALLATIGNMEDYNEYLTVANQTIGKDISQINADTHAYLHLVPGSDEAAQYNQKVQHINDLFMEVLGVIGIRE